MASVLNEKFEVGKSNGKINFELLKLRIWELFMQQRLQKALVGKAKKPTSMTNQDWEDFNAIVVSTMLCLAAEVLFNIMGEDTTTRLWSRVEILYMMKSMTN